ncbi:hypothetical protein BKA69DRAFT_1125505 [Paraphysoderma sedebokerense]|nr:hypothetical protein BKA69DRAFT_1125505 [Paraphysoderma sedebokerense]
MSSRDSSNDTPIGSVTSNENALANVPSPAVELHESFNSHSRAPQNVELNLSQMGSQPQFPLHNSFYTTALPSQYTPVSNAPRPPRVQAQIRNSSVSSTSVQSTAPASAGTQPGYVLTSGGTYVAVPSNFNHSIRLQTYDQFVQDGEISIGDQFGNAGSNSGTPTDQMFNIPPTNSDINSSANNVSAQLNLDLASIPHGQLTIDSEGRISPATTFDISSIGSIAPGPLSASSEQFPPPAPVNIGWNSLQSANINAPSGTMPPTNVDVSFQQTPISFDGYDNLSPQSGYFPQLGSSTAARNNSQQGMNNPWHGSLTGQVVDGSTMSSAQQAQSSTSSMMPSSSGVHTQLEEMYPLYDIPSVPSVSRSSSYSPPGYHPAELARTSSTDSFTLMMQTDNSSGPHTFGLAPAIGQSGDGHSRRNSIPHRMTPPINSSLTSTSSSIPNSAEELLSSSATRVASTSSSNNSSLGRRSQGARKNRADHIKRPPNAYFIYQAQQMPKIREQRPNLTNPEYSQIIAKMWKEESVEVRTQFAELAKKAKQEHAEKYPDYKYRPQRKRRDKRASVADYPASSTPPEGGNSRYGSNPSLDSSSSSLNASQSSSSLNSLSSSMFGSNSSLGSSQTSGFSAMSGFLNMTLDNDVYDRMMFKRPSSTHARRRSSGIHISSLESIPDALRSPRRTSLSPNNHFRRSSDIGDQVQSVMRKHNTLAQSTRPTIAHSMPTPRPHFAQPQSRLSFHEITSSHQPNVSHTSQYSGYPQSALSVASSSAYTDHPHAPQHETRPTYSERYYPEQPYTQSHTPATTAPLDFQHMQSQYHGMPQNSSQGNIPTSRPPQNYSNIPDHQRYQN